MTIRELLDLVVESLDAEGIPYMLTGSVASSLFGEPRSTNDVDVVIDPSGAALDRLVAKLLRSGLYVDLEAARSALRERGQFNANILDKKVDFIIRKAGAYSTAAFERRDHVIGSTINAYVATAEDLILSKLMWAAETGSERQLRDVAGIVSFAASLDDAYVERWAVSLGVLDAWHRAVAEARDA